MRYLDFTANGMKLVKKKGADFNGITAGSKSYLAARVEFNNDWNGMKKIVVFKTRSTEYPVLMHDDVAIMPDKPASKSEISIYVVGRKADGTQMQTNMVNIKLGVM